MLMGDVAIRVLLVHESPSDLFEAELVYPHIAIESSRARTLSAALDALATSGPFDCVVLALGPEGRPGDAIGSLRAAGAGAVVALLPPGCGIAPGEAMRAGASDALVLPQPGGAVARAVVAATALRAARQAAESAALARAAMASAEGSARKLAALVEAEGALVRAAEPELALVALAKAIVPALADACAIDLLDDDGVLRRYPLVDGALLSERADPKRGDGLVAQALSGAEPRLLSAPFEGALGQLLRGGESPARPELVTAALLVPLRGSSPIGVLSLFSCGERAGFSPQERWAAEQLGERLSAALEAGRRATRARQAGEARDHLTSVVSHDLRNPLFNIQMAADELLATAPQTFHRHIEIVRRATRQMNRLIQDLLDVSRLESGRMSIERARVEVGSVVGEAIASHAALAAQRSITVRAEIPEALPRVVADRERLVQALSGLVHNAVKVSPERGAVTVSAEARGGELWLAVRDAGPGIAAEHLPILFDRFAQSKRKDRRSAGLGLAIARGLIELHGGRIWVESRQGEGSTFSLALPVPPGA
jgi:signal transduction histidine kinase